MVPAFFAHVITRRAIDRPVIAILLAMFCYGVMDALSKKMLPSMSAVEIFFFRSAITLLLMVCALPILGGLAILRTKRPWLHAARSIAGIGALYLLLVSFRTMQLAQVLSVVYLTPLLVAIFSIFFPGERPSSGDWIRAACGLAAVMVVLQPNYALGGLTVATPILGAILLAVYLVTARLTPSTEHPILFPLYFTALCTVVSTIGLPFVWRTPSLETVPLLLIIGAAGAAGLFCRNYAYFSDRPAFIAPFEYTSLLWAILFGYLIFGDVPRPSTIIAALAIIAVNLFGRRRGAAQTRPLTKRPLSAAPEG